MRFAPGAQFAEVPMFPLPQVALFPGGALPLHIFEARYRALTEQALGTDRLICMVNLLPGSGSSLNQPNISSIAGLGEIVDFERLADGRFHLLLEGRCRVNLKELEFRGPFRRACLSVLPSLGEEPTATDRSALQVAIRKQVNQIRAARPDFEFEFPAALPTSQLVDLCGQYLIADPGLRQELLETLNVNTRLQLCLSALLDQPGSVPRVLN